MNFSFPPLMNSPQIMQPHLQPSPFSPNQFLTRTTPSPRPESPVTDEEIFIPHPFIKKRPIELTEDLVEGRVEARFRRCRAVSRAPSEPPRSTYECPIQGVEPMTPPNRPQSPQPLTRDSDCLRHSPQTRRKVTSRRSTKNRRSCHAGRKSTTRDSSPAPTRSPLGRWTPPTVSAFQLFHTESSDLPSTPPPSAYSFTLSQPWGNRIPWTITSPSSSPYPSHSPPPHSERQS